MTDVEELFERIQEQMVEVANIIRISDRYMAKATQYTEKARELTEDISKDMVLLEAYMALEGVDMDE
jgi:hypothetical protein